MNQTKKILTNIFLVIMLLALSGVGSLTVQAASKGKYFQSGELYYHTISSGKVEVCGTTKNEGTLTIPAQVSYKGKKYTVTQIADHELYYQDTPVTDETHDGASTNLDMPGWKYYRYDRVDGKDLPNNVDWLSCAGIQKVILPGTLTYIGEGAFGGCENLKTVVFAKKYKKLVIGKDAFCGNKIKKIKFPEGTYELKERAAGVSSEIYIPSSVKKIGAGVVNYKTKKVTISKKNKKFKMKNGILYSKNGKKLLGVTSKVKGSVTVSEKVTSIGEMAFAGTKITSITLNSNIKKIPKGAFYRCDKLTTISGANEVEEIAYGAFAECGNLQSFEELSKLTTIGRAAFWRNYKLAITLPETTKDVDDYAFCGSEEIPQLQVSVAQNNPTLYVENGFLVKKDGEKKTLLLQMDYDGVNGRITIPEGVTHIPVAIEKGKGTEVVLPKSLVYHNAIAYVEGGSIIYQSEKVPELGTEFRLGFNLTYFKPDAEHQIVLKVPSNALEMYKTAIEKIYELQDDTGDESYVSKNGVDMLRIWSVDDGAITLMGI